MYHIFVNDYVNNKQIFLYASTVYLNALEIALNDADEFVRQKMGIKYTGISKKPFSGYGFFYTKSPNKFGKISVYYKEKDGLIFSSPLQKVRTYILVKIPVISSVVSETEMTQENKMIFNDVLSDITDYKYNSFGSIIEKHLGEEKKEEN